MADGLRFTDLTQLASNNVNGQDITAISHYNSGSYSSVALQIQDLGRALLGNLSYTTELPNFGNQTIYGALLQLLANFANIYNPANTYAVNDCVIYQGVLYKCTTAISTPEAWDSTHWTAIKAVDVGQGGGGGGASSLGQLSDVTITSATLSNGQVLKYDSSSQLWINITPDLSLMSDVTISSVSLSNGQFLVYDSTSSKWVNKEIIHEPITQAQYDAMVQAGTVDPNVYYPITDASINLSELGDTNISSPQSGQVLSYNGSKWTNVDTEDISSHLQIQSGFTLRSWGSVSAFKFGKVVVISIWGLAPDNEISSDTNILLLSDTMKAGSVGTVSWGNNSCSRLKNFNNYIQITGTVTSGVAISGQIVVCLA